MFRILTASDEAIYGANVPNLPKDVLSSMASKLRVSQFVWVALMIIIKSLLLISVFWEKINFMLIMGGCEILSIIYDGLINAIFSFVSDILLLIFLGIFVYRVWKEKQPANE